MRETAPLELDAVERAVAEADLRALRVLAQQSEFLVVDELRGAAHVLDCDGHVVAHFPWAVSAGWAATDE
ncbi:MAG: hypothetical protein ABR551_06720 [Gemmatimonadales bacterium]